MAKKPIVQISKEFPPLTLDQKWHELFNGRKTAKMKLLEKQLNDLLKLQGKLNNEYKEYSMLKKNLMSEIIKTMPDAFESNNEHSLDTLAKNKRFVENINEKLERYEKRLATLPKEINEVNNELLNHSMDYCYKQMNSIRNEFSSLDDRINKLREEIKELMIKKNESQEQYERMYSYMHDVVGADIMEQLDIKHGVRDID